jgi:nucleoside-diphosphate-sugar epimerase
MSPGNFPSGFASVAALEDAMTAPSQALINALRAIDGDLIVLGVGGKMGPTLARMAKRAAPQKRVLGVARFSDPAIATQLREAGVEPVSCDLLDREAIAKLPNHRDGVTNVVFMAGHKFGASGNPAFTWAMNVAVPWMVAEHYRECRIVAFSTACVYPFFPTNGPGATEAEPAIPPPGDYAASCVGRERMFEHASQRWGTPGRLVRLSYAIDMRYGVLRDVADAVLNRRAIDLTMGWADVIWQGDANEQALRLLAHCTSPTTPINITGPAHTSIRWLASEFGRRLGREPILTGAEAPTAWLVDTSASQQLFGLPSVPLPTLIDWVADWVTRGGESLGKPTHFEARDGRY